MEGNQQAGTDLCHVAQNGRQHQSVQYTSSHCITFVNAAMHDDDNGKS